MLRVSRMACALRLAPPASSKLKSLRLRQLAERRHTSLAAGGAGSSSTVSEPPEPALERLDGQAE